ncbi:MAG: YgcG family protein [Nitrosomonas sp.]|nr:YgcG family protein [Nitrosomonas sp.]
MISDRINGCWINTLLLIALLFTVAFSSAEVAIPQLKSRVTDLTQTLSTNQAAQLKQKLAAFESKTGNQVAILIIPTTQPETIEQYSIRVVEEWKPGRKGIDDGVLLLIAKNDKTLRIEVGYGLEGALTDALSKRIIDEIIVPNFRQGDFAGGIDAGIEKILGVIEGEPLPPPKIHDGMDASHSRNALLDNFIPILIGLIVAGRIVQAKLGRLAGATITSVAGGFIMWFIFSSLAVAIFIAFVTFILNIFGNPGKGVYSSRRGGLSGYSGYRRGGGFGGSGFSGGGGGFGGGGASGRW